MFDLSRIMLGTYRLRIEPTDLMAVARASVDAIAPVAAARGISVQCADSGASEWLAGDALRLQQAISNVLSNAVKHTPPGGRVGLTVVAGADRLMVRIVDNGEGIAPALLPHIFEPLTRSLRGDPVHDGTGLGLALVRHIVELHGGFVTAESEGCSHGAVFTLALPRAHAPETTAVNATAGEAAADRACPVHAGTNVHQAR
jgi:signal transduction histidine kinase